MQVLAALGVSGLGGWGAVYYLGSYTARRPGSWFISAIGGSSKVSPLFVDKPGLGAAAVGLTIDKV